MEILATGLAIVLVAYILLMFLVFHVDWHRLLGICSAFPMFLSNVLRTTGIKFAKSFLLHWQTATNKLTNIASRLINRKLPQS